MNNHSNNELRIFHGLTGQAGQPWMLSDAMRKLGHKADSFVFQTAFSYSCDIAFKPLKWNPNIVYNSILDFAFENYDIFHLYSKPFFYTKNLSAPFGTDILALRAARKAVVVNFRGSEVRRDSIFRKSSPFHFLDDQDEKVLNMKRSFPEDIQKLMIDFISSTASSVLVTDPELQQYVPNSTIVPRAIDLKNWKFVGSVNKNRPLVVHAPSRRAIKGTRFVLEAVDRLRNKGLDFDFRLVEGLSNDKARELYKKADIVVDQLRIGWYGVLAVEAMALGKCVISFVADHLTPYFKQEIPLLIANPRTIEGVLGEAISNFDLREKTGRVARRFCESEHDAEKVAAKLIEVYKNAIESPNSIDYGGVHRLLEYQSTIGSKRYSMKYDSKKSDSLLDYLVKFRRTASDDGITFALRKSQSVAWNKIRKIVQTS